MVFSVRLDEATKRRLDEMARVTGRSRSDLVRDAIRTYDPGLQTGDDQTVYDRLSGVIGVASIGGNRARESENILREAFARKSGRPFEVYP